MKRKLYKCWNCKKDFSYNNAHWKEVVDIETRSTYSFMQCPDCGSTYVEQVNKEMSLKKNVVRAGNKSASS